MNYEDRVTKAAVEAAIAGSIVFGTYTGDGTAERTIELGFTPRAVYVQMKSGRTYIMEPNTKGHYYCGGLFWPDHPIADMYDRNALEVVSGGFTVRQATYESGYNYHYANSVSQTYYYMALR